MPQARGTASFTVRVGSEWKSSDLQTHPHTCLPSPPPPPPAAGVAGWVSVAYSARLCSRRSESPCIHSLVNKHLLEMSRSYDQEL